MSCSRNGGAPTGASDAPSEELIGRKLPSRRLRCLAFSRERDEPDPLAEQRT